MTSSSDMGVKVCNLVTEEDPFRNEKQNITETHCSAESAKVSPTPGLFDPLARVYHT